MYPNPFHLEIIRNFYHRTTASLKQEGNEV
jgi:hypothetical protein